MSVLKWKVNSSSNFALFFIVMTHNSSVNFKVIPFLLWTKGSHQSSNFDTFKCFGENLPNFSCLFSNHWSFFKICITPQYHERWLLGTFSWIYTLATRSQLKKSFLAFSSAQVKICDVHVNFKMRSQFLFNYCIIIHCHHT